jgi:hypothetical protein
VAYGPEAIIVVPALAGAGALHLVVPITVAIVALLAILVFSNRQVIDAYPSAGLVAAAALVVDYTLTVAVSVTAGVASLASAFPGLRSAKVPICLGILAVITLLNLRGLGAAARAFLLPTLVFIVGLLAIIAIGLVHPLALHAAQPGRPRPSADSGAAPPARNRHRPRPGSGPPARSSAWRLPPGQRAAFRLPGRAALAGGLGKLIVDINAEASRW